MLIDELLGTPLLLKEPSREQLQHVYDQWAGILCGLHTHPFDQIGSLTFQSNGEISVGPIVGDRTGTFSQMGPFRNAREYYSIFAEKYLEMICHGQLFSAYPANAYLIFRYLQELANSGRWNAFESNLDDGPFFLKHMDDKGDHILVDNEYNITGIIDWTYARIVPAFEAFGPSLLTANMNDIFEGKSGRSTNDIVLAEALQRRDKNLGRIANGPDLVRRFSFALGMGMGLSWEEAQALFQALISTATGIPLTLDWEVWRQNRIYQWADDSRLQALLRLQDGHFENQKTIKNIQSYHTPRFSTCSVAECTRPGARGRSCASCKNHFCAKHLSKEYHTCPSSHEWIVRIPRSGFSDVPPELVESEYATLKFLEPTRVPSPKAFACGLASDPSNRVGVGYLMMEALPGKPFYAHDASPEHKKGVIQQVADILIEISKHPLPLVGSLVTKEDDQIDVSVVASNRFVSLGTYGPFKTTLDYITSIIDQHMDLISDGQLQHEHPSEAFLFYRFLRQNTDTLITPDMPGQFFLKHVDDKGDHLLVDKDFNITGIIDWQFARIVPAAEAFGPSYVTADLMSLYSSNTNVTDDDRLLAQALKSRGFDMLASFAEGSESMRRFHNGLPSGLTKDEAREMLKGMVACVQGKKLDDLDAWIIKQGSECQNDPRWGGIQSLLKEQGYESPLIDSA